MLWRNKREASCSAVLGIQLGQTEIMSMEGVRRAQNPTGGLAGSVPKVVIWELHHLPIPHSSATSQDERQLCCPCPAGLFPPLREEERALPANSPGPQTSFHSGLPHTPEKETSESGNLTGVCSGRAPCPCRSTHGNALQRACMPGEGKAHHPAPAITHASTISS